MSHGCYFGSVYINPLVEDAISLRNELIDDFIALKDTVTGRNVVKNIYRVEEIYSGPFIELMPQFFLEPEEDYCLRLGSPDRIFKEIDFDEDVSGGHHLEGIISIWGKNIKNLENIRCNILDIAPTVLAVLGIDIPDYMDGRVLEELFHEKPEVKIKSYEEYSVGTEVNVHVFEDEDVVKKRLEDLGYM